MLSRILNIILDEKLKSALLDFSGQSFKFHLLDYERSWIIFYDGEQFYNLPENSEYAVLLQANIIGLGALFRKEKNVPNAKLYLAGDLQLAQTLQSAFSQFKPDAQSFLLEKLGTIIGGNIYKTYQFGQAQVKNMADEFLVNRSEFELYKNQLADLLQRLDKLESKI